MFDDKISKILQLQGLTAYAVAKGTGISQGTMGEYVSGKKKPGLDNLVKIADFLDVSLDDLCDRNQEEDDDGQSKTLHFHVISKKGSRARKGREGSNPSFSARNRLFARKTGGFSFLNQ